MDINKMNYLEKCIFAIKIGEYASGIFDGDSEKTLIDEALGIAKEWVDSEQEAGETLYFFLDNEDNGFTLSQEMEENETKINAWNCIIDAVAFVARAAYEKEGQEYFPEPIEIVDDSVISHMIQSLLKCDNSAQHFIEIAYQTSIEK